MDTKKPESEIVDPELSHYSVELEKLVEQRTGELTLANRRLKELSQKIISAQEEERSRVAMNLHDELGQALTALSMEVEWLQKQPQVTKQDLSDLEATIHQIHESLQRVYKGLRPIALDRFGLQAALQSLVWEYRDQYDFQVKADIESTACDMDRERGIIIYRIVQEALTNVARHSSAGHVVVSLARRDHLVTLEIKDDGVGFGPDTDEDDSQGFGIMGMRERAAICSGEFSIISTPGKGTCVRLSLNV